MALPLYLAMTDSEMSSIDVFPANFAYMACHFSPYSQGISNAPDYLPGEAILILNDNFPCQGHSPSLVAHQIKEVLTQFQCESLLMDFQRPPETESEHIVQALLSELPFPVALPPAYARDWNSPVFLPPCPLHMPLEDYLEPWKGRDIWIEAALCQETVTITKDGSLFTPQFPPEGLEGGFYDDGLCCQYTIQTTQDQITFTLFDTRESLQRKLKKAHSLGVTRAVGLYQELGHA